MDTQNTNNTKEEVGRGVAEEKKKETVKKKKEENVSGTSDEQDDVELVSDESLDERLEKQLDTMSLESVASVSSSILNTPNRSSVQQVQGAGDDESGQCEEVAEKGRSLRMSEAELKRFNWLLGRGHSLDAARELCRFPVAASGQQKRQRSEDQSSPNTSGQAGPQTKRSKDNQKPGPGVTYKEMAEAVPIAVISVDYPETRLSREQLAAVSEALLTAIGNLINPVVRPNFRSCNYKQGYLQLACGDPSTASWLKEAVLTLTPWEGAALKAIEVADLPKLHPFYGYFFDSCNDSTARILQLVENQNVGLSTKSWRVVSRKAIAKTVEILLEVDEKSAGIIAANDSNLNFKFGKVRLRKVTGGAPTAKRGNSVAQSSNHAKGQQVQQNGKQAKTQQPTASSSNAATGTGPKTACGKKPQPLASSNSQKPLQGNGRNPGTQRTRASATLNQDTGSSHIGDTAVGDRQPTPGSNGQRAEDGTLPGQ